MRLVVVTEDEHGAIGRAILHHCEAEARAHGFTRFELMATVPGERLYIAEGYVPTDHIEYEVGDGVSLALIPMTKRD